MRGEQSNRRKVVEEGRWTGGRVPSQRTKQGIEKTEVQTKKRWKIVGGRILGRKASVIFGFRDRSFNEQKRTATRWKESNQRGESARSDGGVRSGPEHKRKCHNIGFIR